MSALDWYWCSFSDFSKPFRENEVVFNQARSYWHQLDAAACFALVIAIATGVGFAIYYYTAFNERPGRHYKPTFWWCFLGITALITILTTLLMEVVLASPRLEGALGVELKIAFVNMLYAVVLFLIVSFIWCNFQLHTNAYRYLKIWKS